MDFDFTDEQESLRDAVPVSYTHLTLPTSELG